MPEGVDERVDVGVPVPDCVRVPVGVIVCESVCVAVPEPVLLLVEVGVVV